MEHVTSLLQEFLLFTKILGPAGILNVALAHYFLKDKLTPVKAVSAIFSPMIIVVAAVFVSETVINLFPSLPGGDGLGGTLPALLLAVAIVTLGFYVLYKKILCLNGKQTSISIITLIIVCVLSMLAF